MTDPKALTKEFRSRYLIYMPAENPADSMTIKPGWNEVDSDAWEMTLHTAENSLDSFNGWKFAMEVL